MLCFLLPPGYFPPNNEIILIKKWIIKPWTIFKIWEHYIFPSVAKQHTFAMIQSETLINILSCIERIQKQDILITEWIFLNKEIKEKRKKWNRTHVKLLHFYTGNSKPWILQFEKTQCTELIIKRDSMQILKLLQPCENVAMSLPLH